MTGRDPAKKVPGRKRGLTVDVLGLVIAVIVLADRLPAAPPELPKHPDYPCILLVFNDATGPLRARDVCEALDHEILPKNIEGTRAKLERLVKLGILTEIGTGSFTSKQ
ncbi:MULTISPECIES: hypothetical protein [unclassified Streptomyces]|uniref:hypothetical protein n=1 Tax=Streptomyces sp. CS081A TaxID=2162709 RepID=UPI00099F43AF|nr:MULTISPECIES: hypothetical protein [unclassified Streptomyces]